MDFGRRPLDRIASDDSIECVLSRYTLPDADGVAFLEAVRAQRPNLPFVLRFGTDRERAIQRAIEAGVTDYLVATHHDTPDERLATIVSGAVPGRGGGCLTSRSMSTSPNEGSAINGSPSCTGSCGTISGTISR